MRTTLSLLITATVLGACAGDSTAPQSSRRDAEQLAVIAATGTAGDTSHTTSYPASVRVSGRVLRGNVLATTTPVAGAHVTLYRNVLVSGKGVSLFVAETTTGSDGAFLFPSAPGGPYVIAYNVTADRFYGDALAYAMGNVSAVSADIVIR